MLSSRDALDWKTLIGWKWKVGKPYTIHTVPTRKWYTVHTIPK